MKIRNFENFKLGTDFEKAHPSAAVSRVDGSGFPVNVPNWEHRSDQRYRPPPAENDKRCLRFALLAPLVQPLSNGEEVGCRPTLRCRIQLYKGRLRR